MKKLAVFLTFIFICQSFSILNIQKTILGEWNYKYSLINNTAVKIITEKHCPVDKMLFKKCLDKKELKGMPTFLINLRKKDIFENISCETFNDNIKIDKYFPVVTRLVLRNDTTYNVINYGIYHKSEYYIERLSNDTLVIFDDKDYSIEGVRYTAVKHIYTRKK
jgi:hypothetical protein